MSRSHSKIRSAIELLEGLEKKAGSVDFNSKYSQLKDTLIDILQERKEEFERAKDAAMDAFENGRERVEEATSHLDKHAHKNPWAFVGAAALVSLLLGFVLGHSKK